WTPPKFSVFACIYPAASLVIIWTCLLLPEDNLKAASFVVPNENVFPAQSDWRCAELTIQKSLRSEAVGCVAREGTGAYGNISTKGVSGGKLLNFKPKYFSPRSTKACDNLPWLR